MTQTNDTCRGGRPSGAGRPADRRLATRRTRVRVASDAVVSAYIRDIALPHAGVKQHDPHPVIIPAPSLNRVATIDVVPTATGDHHATRRHQSPHPRRRHAGAWSTR